MGDFAFKIFTKTKIARRTFAGAVAFVLFFSGVGVRPLIAHAADLSVSPSSGSYDIGKTFSVNINVRTPDQAMNAISGIVTFPPDLLTVTSIGKGGSVVTLWVQEPSYSNSGGTVNFEGIVLNPGYTGGAGRVLTINFRAKAAGSATVAFNSGSVLANDGEGTEILSGMGRANFTIGSKPAPVKEEQPPVEKPPVPDTATRAPRGPLIASSTHADPEKWYANKNPIFNWAAGADVNGVNVLADQNPGTNPGTTPDGLFNTYHYYDVDEGAWYFHVRLRNSKGWGDVSHFKFQIDTEKPESLVIKQVDDAGATNKTLAFAFESLDKTSGIDYYQVGLDNAEPQLWRGSTSASVYELPRPQAGKHTLNVRAVDKAGNSLAKTFEFMVTANNAPEITKYPKRVTSGDSFVVAGQAQDNVQVIVWVQRIGASEKPYMTTSGDDGSFSRKIEEVLSAGTYVVWAQSVDGNSIKSALSEKVTITVKAPFILTTAHLVWGFGVLFGIMSALIATLFIWVYRLRREVTKLKRSVYGVGSIKNAVRSAAMLVRRRTTPVVRKKIVRPTIRKDEL